MCKRSVLVNFKPGLFTVLLVITLIAIAKPGACSSRFVYLNENADYSALAEELTSFHGLRRGAQAILSEGKAHCNYLLKLMPEGKPSIAAGGIFVDIDDEKLRQLQQIDNAIESVVVGEEKLQNYSEAGLRYSQTQNKAQWNFKASGADLMKQFYSTTGQNRSLAVISLDYPYGHQSLQGKIKQYKLFGDPDEKRGIKDLHLVHPLGILVGYEETMFEGIVPDCEVILAQISQKAVKTVTMLEAIEWILSFENPFIKRLGLIFG